MRPHVGRDVADPEARAMVRRAHDAQPQRVGRYRIDVVRRRELVEIQLASLSAIRDKVASLAVEHRVLLVKPLVARKLLVKRARPGGRIVARRWSPKRATMLDLFEELVHFTRVFPRPRLTLEVLLMKHQIALGELEPRGLLVIERADGPGVLERGGKLRLGAVERDLEGLRVDAEEKRAARDGLIGLYENLDDTAVDIGADRDLVRLDVGIIGRHVTAAGKVEVSAGHQGDERADERDNEDRERAAGGGPEPCT